MAIKQGWSRNCQKTQAGPSDQLAGLAQAIERGYRAYDFLRGDEPYKANFRATTPSTHGTPHRSPPNRRPMAPRTLGSRPNHEAMDKTRGRRAEGGGRKTPCGLALTTGH